MSLRARLALLAAFAIFALGVALFVAWRLARTTESFAIRVADSSVRTAAGDLAREIQMHSDGYRTVEDAMNPPKRVGDNRPGPERPPRIPPHIADAFAAYSDPLARLTAITIHRFPDVEAGFYRAEDRAMIGYASEKNSTTNVSPDLLEPIRSLASQAASTNAPASNTIRSGSDRIVLSAYPTQTNGVTSAWAMQRLSNLSGVSDWPNAAAIVALAISIIAVSGLALLTVRDLRFGVSNIERGLAELKSDLSHELSSPNTEELARIAVAINELAADLRANIQRQAELEQALRKSERLSALGRLVSGVAHEVRNPLSAIKLKVQLAGRASYASEKVSETFRVITAEIERLDSLVRRLLELGGQQAMAREDVDLVQLLNNRVALLADVAARAGVSIDISRAAGRFIVIGDQDRLGQVMDNVMQNSIEAMPDGGSLTISLTESSAPEGTTWVRVRFDDTGRGISAMDKEHIFEPFYTGHDSGTGLGLAIARAIVEEHGGNISFANRDPKGASFVIELPVTSNSELNPAI